MNMKKRSNLFLTILGSAGMLILILDSQLVFRSAAEGIDMCLKSIIPALFPFLVVSSMITGCVCINKKGQSSIITKFMGIPSGTEYLLLLGFLGGYPNGAQNVYQLYDGKNIKRKDAERMLPICNQAGPAFIFGMIPCLFTSLWIPFTLWVIQIVSALVASAILPGKSRNAAHHCMGNSRNVVAALQTAVRTMGWICGWVVLFRIIIVFIEQRVFAFLPVILQVIIAGLLELSNGIFSLNATHNEFVRFVLTSVFLSFGGLCVLLQTKSVVKDLSLNVYFLGKVMQLLIAMLLSVIIYPLIFGNCEISVFILSAICLLLSLMIAVFVVALKKIVAIPKKVLYNKKKSESEVLV